MEIVEITVYQKSLTVPPSGYKISKGRNGKSFEATIVSIKTDAGLIGVGETCPFGSNYLPAFAGAIKPGLTELAPHLIGLDPRRVSRINQVMDEVLSGHPYVKSCIDIACWDILGKSVGLPIHELLGGKLNERVPIRIGIPISDSRGMTSFLQRKRQEGFCRFNMKAGDDPDKDIESAQALCSTLQSKEMLVIDANCGWRLDEALYVTRSLRDFPQIFFEQPCATYEECLELRRRTECKIMLDEVVTDFASLMRAYRDGAAEAITFKISRMGGITKTRLARDVTVELGMLVTIQDSWGSELMDAAIAQLGHSTPGRYFFGGWCSIGHVEEHLTKRGPAFVEGSLVALDAPGLGVELDYQQLGQPVAVFQ
jgi:L-alanine-DL-glutamate epimerase-like enolase superfamily enzyme